MYGLSAGLEFRVIVAVLGLCDATYDSLSGNHWHVKLGQSRAWVMTRSYKYGAFFFL